MRWTWHDGLDVHRGRGRRVTVVTGGASGLVGAYEAGLQRYVDSGDEVELAAAYAFSREAFGAEMTILDVVDVHRGAVERLVGRASSADIELIAASFSFLSQALSTFEMTQRGYWEAQQHAEREHAIALSLQHDLLPRAVPEVAGLDLSVRYVPGEAGSHAGGDWYDVFELDANRVGLVVGDVTGHGVRAAAAMGRLRVAVLVHALAGLGPADVVKRVDRLLDQLGTGEIATMVYVVADPGRGRLVVANAGHPPPVVVEPDGASRLLEMGHGRLLGLRPALRRRDQDVMQIRSGGHFLLYTDGLIEPLERAGRDGVAQLCRVVEGFSGTAQQLCERVLGELAPEGARDDICVVAATLVAQPRSRRLGRRAPRRSIVRPVETSWLSRLGRR